MPDSTRSNFPPTGAFSVSTSDDYSYGAAPYEGTKPSIWDTEKPGHRRPRLARLNNPIDNSMETQDYIANISIAQEIVASMENSAVHRRTPEVTMNSSIVDVLRKMTMDRFTRAITEYPSWGGVT